MARVHKIEDLDLECGERCQGSREASSQQRTPVRVRRDALSQPRQQPARKSATCRLAMNVDQSHAPPVRQRLSETTLGQRTRGADEVAQHPLSAEVRQDVIDARSPARGIRSLAPHRFTGRARSRVISLCDLGRQDIR